MINDLYEALQKEFPDLKYDEFMSYTENFLIHPTGSKRTECYEVMLEWVKESWKPDDLSRTPNLKKLTHNRDKTSSDTGSRVYNWCMYHRLPKSPGKDMLYQDVGMIYDITREQFDAHTKKLFEFDHHALNEVLQGMEDMSLSDNRGNLKDDADL